MILSERTIRSLARRHGQIMGQAEQAEVVALAALHDLAPLDLTLVPHGQIRRRALWPAAVSAAVDAVLTSQQARPPDGVSWADWERVLAARPAQATCPVVDPTLIRAFHLRQPLLVQIGDFFSVNTI